MITGWKNRDDYWANTTSPGFDRDLKYRGYLEIRGKLGGGKLGDVLNLQTYLLKSEYLLAVASFSPRITAFPIAVTD